LDKVLFNDIYQIFMSFYVMYDCILSICFIKEMMMMMMMMMLGDQTEHTPKITNFSNKNTNYIF